MNSLHYRFGLIILFSGIVNMWPAFGMPPIVPDERDREVLEIALLHLLADETFDMARGTVGGDAIVLASRTPERTIWIRPEKIRRDIGSRELPSYIEHALWRRNTPTDAEPDANVAVVAFYTKRMFRSNVVVAELAPNPGRRLVYSAFREAHPNARGWVQAYLPGYSENGEYAIVRGLVGPSEHGALVTVLLASKGGKWMVKWHHVTRHL